MSDFETGGPKTVGILSPVSRECKAYCLTGFPRMQCIFSHRLPVDAMHVLSPASHECNACNACSRNWIMECMQVLREPLRAPNRL